MKRINRICLVSFAFWIGLFFATCKKEIKQTEYTQSTLIQKVYNLKGDFPYAQIKRNSGGYFLVYGENVNWQKDVSVAITDDVGNVLHKTTFGGSKNEAIWFTHVDEIGNLYICGLTYSPELRIDKNAKKTNVADGYLAKLDKDGKLLWQRGYSDTTSFKKGINYDAFMNVYLMNNKLYCIGMTGNRYTATSSGATDYDPWLVTFDENGNVLKDRVFPTIKKGASGMSFGGLYAMDAIRLNNNDLLFRYDFMDYQSQSRNMDTTAMLFRYNLAADTVLYTKYYRKSSPQGDICFMGLLGNGNVAFIDTYWNTINIMDVNNGNLLSTTTINNNTASVTSNQYYMYMGISPFNINDNLYFVGYSSVGGSVNNQKPFVTKLNSQGALVYTKTFDIPLGYFYWISKTNKNNLQFMGSLNAYNTNNKKIFTLTTDENGHVLTN